MGFALAICTVPSLAPSAVIAYQGQKDFALSCTVGTGLVLLCMQPHLLISGLEGDWLFSRTLQVLVSHLYKWLQGCKYLKEPL